MTPAKKSSKQPSFEEAVERLEGLIESIESGEIGLDDSLKAFEEGMALIKSCRQTLDAAEQRVTELMSDDGESAGE